MNYFNSFRVFLCILARCQCRTLFNTERFRARVRAREIEYTYVLLIRDICARSFHFVSIESKRKSKKRERNNTNR